MVVVVEKKLFQYDIKEGMLGLKPENGYFPVYGIIYKKVPTYWGWAHVTLAIMQYEYLW